jgi:hypothetical protein
MSSARDTEQRSRRVWIVVGLVVAAAVAVVLGVALTSSGGSTPTASSGGKPVAVITPAPGSTTYHDGQSVSISVGPNKYFAPYSRIIIIECGDPGGTIDNLPKSSLTCDGNTAPGYSVLVNKDGSFSASNYQLASLPNTVFSESYDEEPVCNQTHQCVLYIGQDQSNFTQPKIFSAPFAIVASHVPRKP